MPPKKTKKNSSEQLEEYLYNRPTFESWKKIGYNPRFGTLIPLSSLRSKRNQGIGDFADLHLFKDFSKKIGSSIIQLLPINDMGQSKVPYSSISAFALDPVYIALDEIPEIKENRSEAVNQYFEKNWHTIVEQKNQEFLDVDKIRVFKFGVLYKVFWDFINRNRPSNTTRWRAFQSYIYSNQYWLDDYAIFRTLKNQFKWIPWKDWPVEYRDRYPEVLNKFKHDNYHEILFVKFIQWTAYEQMVHAHNHCRRENILIKGDIPLQVDFESADVWAHKNYFNLDVCAGAPPDQYSKMGQNWGSPTFNWDNLGNDNYIWWRKRLEYATNFYDIYRIDHIVGIFRIWTVPITEEYPRGKPSGWNAFYAPEDNGNEDNKPIWENHGKSLLKMMIESTEMLPIGEDLGNIPYVCRYVMKNLGIPGYKVLIWERDWSQPGAPFVPTENYDYLSMATTTTHDFWSLPGYWLHREDHPDRAKEQNSDIKALWKFVTGKTEPDTDYSDNFHREMLDKIFHCNSIFLIIPFADLWGKIPKIYGVDINADRINDPSNPERSANWATRIPLDIEDFPKNKSIKNLMDYIDQLAISSGRIVK
jgi:4-alpha-glucanotransferase